MVTTRPRQFNEITKVFDPIRPSEPFTTRPPSIQKQEQSQTRYQPPQRNNDQNWNNFNEKNFSLYDSSTVFPLPALSQISVDDSVNFEHLRIEWTESETKWEYIARYNRLENGLWMASAPQRKLNTETIRIDIIK